MVCIVEILHIFILVSFFLLMNLFHLKKCNRFQSVSHIMPLTFEKNLSHTFKVIALTIKAHAVTD